MRTPTPRRAVFAAYWRFAAERQLIFERRLAGLPGPWTDDPVLSRFRFCNAFRASDRVSQYLIQTVTYGAPGDLDIRDAVARTVLFRLFSRPSTWELIEQGCGPVRAETFDPKHIGRVLDEALASGQRLYTGAFILCANAAYGHRRKHRNHLALVDAMLRGGLPERLKQTRTLDEVYRALLEYPLIGPFMAYQLAIDLNYGPHMDFDENQFTMPGPGALRGLGKVFCDLGDLSPQGAIDWLVEQQPTVEKRFGVAAPTLFGRPLHAIDCQNLLCEVDKYARVAFPELASDRQRIKQTFSPAGSLPALFYPPRWGVNNRIPIHARAEPGAWVAPTMPSAVASLGRAA